MVQREKNIDQLTTVGYFSELRCTSISKTLQKG